MSKIHEDLIREKLDSLSEDAMTTDILVPLYKKRFSKAFFEIEFTGGSRNDDQGIDLTYYELTQDTSQRAYTGVQVKQGEINTGKSANGIASIINQATQAFAKRICDPKTKNEYRIRTFKILTTGDIIPRARVQIVDQFKDKNIEFINGKDIAKWINESYSAEFLAHFKIPFGAPTVPSVDEKPINVVAEFIESEFLNELDEIRASLKPLDSFGRRIVWTIISNRICTPYQIAKHLSSSKQLVEDSIGELRQDGILDFDDQGELYINVEGFESYDPLFEAADKRIHDLGYASELDAEDVLQLLIWR